MKKIFVVTRHYVSPEEMEKTADEMVESVDASVYPTKELAVEYVIESMKTSLVRHIGLDKTANLMEAHMNGDYSPKYRRDLMTICFPFGNGDRGIIEYTDNTCIYYRIEELCH